MVLVSGVGSNLQALLVACRDPAYAATVVAVGADRSDAGGLARAREAAIPTFVVPVTEFADRPSWDRAFADAVAAHRPDLVVCAGFMRLFGPAVLARFPNRIVNTHPALLPAFPGAHAVRDALAYGVVVTGATVHLVDAGIDTGPVVDQAPVRVQPGDDEARLHERIKAVEHGLLVAAVGRLLGGYTVEGRKVVFS